tara:strand:+ start:143 stop:487 length:345 start_codon:yes stop_codon:yes gene_type:complete
MENYFNLTNGQREEFVDSKTRDDRVTVSLMTGEKVDCVDVQPRVFNTHLIDNLGMTKKRACMFGIVVEQLHKEVCSLDTNNRNAIINMTLAELLDLYGTTEELYNSFATDHLDN